MLESATTSTYIQTKPERNVKKSPKSFRQSQSSIIVGMCTMFTVNGYLWVEAWFFVISARAARVLAEEVARKTMSKALLSAHTNDISCGAQRRSFGFGAFP